MEVLQHPCEFDPVVALYKKLNPRRVLEIGCWDGGTLREWLSTLPDLVVAVDLHHRNPGAYPGWKKPGTDLQVITGDSLSDPVIETIRSFGPYDWAFIDGDHSQRGVCTDVATALPLNPGGRLVLHDIIPANRYRTSPPGDVADEFEAQGYRVHRFIDTEVHPWEHGIAVIEIP